MSTIVFGHSGFVGKKLVPHIENVVIPSIRLDNPAYIGDLKNLFQNGDTIIMLAALTPGRGSQRDILLTNIRMIENILIALEGKNIRQFINFSTDSVYPIDDAYINEEKDMKPDSLYGLSHMVREAMLKDAIPADKLTILRPTGIYGIGDTHGSYGLNRFIRDAQESGVITTFNGGQDIRGHVYIDDVVNITLHAFHHKIIGDYNIGSLHSCTFMELATIVQEHFKCKIKDVERDSPTTKRIFDLTKLVDFFPPPRSPLVGARDMIHALQSS